MTSLLCLVISVLLYVLNQAVPGVCTRIPWPDRTDIDMQGHCGLDTPRAKRLILAINAANGSTNWDHVNSLADRGNWEVQELVLENFGSVMNEQSFTGAVGYFFHVLKDTVARLQPDILLASSKGVGVIAYLASKNIWVQQPVILLSPIPNPIADVVDGSSYEAEWRDTVEVMRKQRLGPVLIAAGSSTDEEVFINVALQAPSACGEMQSATGTFEKCKGWRLVVIPGDHSWKNMPTNEATVATLIDFMVLWIEKSTGDG